jgi:hypothetical protein
VKVYTIEADSDVGPNDDCYHPFWRILEDGRTIARADHGEDAHKIIEALTHVEKHKNRPGLRDNY